MLLKIILVFLLAMALVGMIGKAFFPTKLDRLSALRRKSLSSPVCRRCGRYMIGKSDCDCGKA